MPAFSACNSHGSIHLDAKVHPESSLNRSSHSHRGEIQQPARRIALIVAPVEALAGTKLGTMQTEEPKSLITVSPDELNYGITDRTLGAAYLAIGDYKSAARRLTVAWTGRDDPKALALRSAAFGELAIAAKKESERTQYAELAAASFRAALKSPSANVTELPGFAKSNVTLEGILSEHGVKMTTQAAKEPQPER